MPVSRNDHHTQFSATPFSRTRLVTRFGVSVENVVATIEMPTSHHGAARPGGKNSVVFWLARRQKKIAGRNEITMLAPMMIQSRFVNFMGDGWRWTVDGGGQAGCLRLPVVAREIGELHRGASLGHADLAQRERRAPRRRVVHVDVGNQALAQALH